MSASDLITKAVAELGAAAVVSILRTGVEEILKGNAGASEPSTKLAARVKEILGDRLLSEIEYDAAMEALRRAKTLVPPPGGEE